MTTSWLPCAACGDDTAPKDLREAFLDERPAGDRVCLICAGCADEFRFDEDEGLLVRRAA